MQANLENLGTLERRLSISVPFADIESEVQSRLRKVARTAKIQGFRPGKAPMNIVAQHYGYQVREDVLNATVEKSFAEAVRENQLKVAGYPRFDAENAAAGAETLTFKATFEVFPEVKLESLAGKALENPVFTVTEVEVEQTISILRKQRTRFQAVTRPAATGDRVIVDFVGSIGGEAFDGGSGQNVAFVVGEGQMLPEFDKGVLGLAEGETRVFDLNFPADYHGKDVAGKTAQFNVTVKAVSEAEVPAVDSEFAKLLGIDDGDLSRMRSEVHSNVEREVARRLKARRKENVMQALLASAELDLPKSLVTMEISRMLQQAKSDIAARGIDPETMPLQPQAFVEPAQRRVKLGLVLAEVVRSNNLQVKPEAVRAIIEDVAASYEDPSEVVRWYYADASRMETPNSVALEDAVVEWAFANAKVSDTTVGFEELMGRS